jgi:hypothetical protein
MAGFEVVVRPVILPSIRPAPAQSLPPQDDPDKGFAVIHGNGGKHIDLSSSWSASGSTAAKKENKRRVDKSRIYQKDAQGNINRNNFVDVEVANKIWMEGSSRKTSGVGFGTPEVGSDSPGSTVTEMETWNLQRLKEADNIEIKERNKMVYPP